jgi:hypothetical protein
VEHAGKTARCPICSTIYTVPEASASTEPASPHDRWRLQTPEGQEYGPVSRSVLDTWVAEGRVSEDCRLLCEADGVWQPADIVYGALRPVLVGSVTPMWHNEPLAPGESLVESPVPIGARGRVINPDRGGIVLALGIVSWATGCPIFGILAWVMGSGDLHEMRQGTMDRRGQGMTEAGRLIGMLHTFVSLIALIVGLFLLMFWGIFW